MDIACCIDDGYTQHCGVLMTSIFENNRGQEITLHIVTLGLNEENERSLRNITQCYDQRLQIYTVDRSQLRDCSLRKGTHVSFAAYNKILIAQILAEDVERVLYLDSDITVRRSLAELWEVELEDYSVAAAVDMGGDNVENYTRLEYDRALGYFNSGVMLLNLKYWREHNLSERVMEYISENQHKFKFNDQDPLNYMLRETKRFIPLRYNAMPGVFHKDFNRLGLSEQYREEVEEAARNPIILHCAARIKPWHVGCLYPYKEEYRKYKALTQWAGVKSELKYPGMVLERLLKRLLYMLSFRPLQLRYMEPREDRKVIR